MSDLLAGELALMGRQAEHTVRVRATSRRVYTVRLIGIDTPETKRPGVPVECGGKQATDRVLKLAFTPFRGSQHGMARAGLERPGTAPSPGAGGSQGGMSAPSQTARPRAMGVRPHLVFRRRGGAGPNPCASSAQTSLALCARARPEPGWQVHP